MKGKLGILFGIVFGAMAPMILLALVYLIFIIGDEPTDTELFQKNVVESTILLGCGVNLGIMLRAFKRSYDYVGRGIVLSTFGYFIYWVIQFV